MFHCVFVSHEFILGSPFFAVLVNGLPQHSILAITPRAADLSCLVSHLQFPRHRVFVVHMSMVMVVILVVVVMGVAVRSWRVQHDCVVLTGAGAKVHCGPSA